MKVVHFTSWAPRQSGMYESVKDQIKYERKAGLESEFCDPHEKYKNGRDVTDDGWLTPIAHKKAGEAEVWVMHAYLPDSIKKDFDKKATVAILHGPNEHMLLKEWTSGRSNAAFNLHITIMWQYKATVALNKHEYDILKLYDEKERLCYIPNSIDLERYQGENAWTFQNHPAIGSFDVPRLEKLPAHIIWAMPRIAEKLPEARLNVYSLTLEPVGTWRNIFCRSKERKLQQLCENIQLECNDLRPFMRGIDIGFNNNISGIASRVTMEMMAMGKPVISYGGDYTDYIARIWDLDSIAEQVVRCWKDLQRDPAGVSKRVRKFVAQNFDREKHVKTYIRMYETMLGKPQVVVPEKPKPKEKNG